MSPIITLTTDFGLSDPYVGVMKGVILSILPDARIVDLSHDVAPYNARQAAFVVGQAVAHFPAQTVHLVVVDPGVGSDRRALVARGRHAQYIGPDQPDGALLGPLLAADGPVVAHCIEPSELLPAPTCRTFHGRDLLAPAAAHLAAGVALEQFGPQIDDPPCTPLPAAIENTAGWQGEVLHIDHFGNLVTSLPGALATQFKQLQVGGDAVPLVTTYSDGRPGTLAALVGSSGYLEIFVREGNACQRLGVMVGDLVTATHQSA